MKELTLTIGGDRGTGKTQLLVSLASFLAAQGFSIGRVRDGVTGAYQRDVEKRVRNAAAYYQSDYNGRVVNLIAENTPADNLGQSLLDLGAEQSREAIDATEKLLLTLKRHANVRSGQAREHKNRFHRDEPSERGWIPTGERAISRTDMRSDISGAETFAVGAQRASRDEVTP